MEAMFYNYDVPVEKVKEFVGEGRTLFMFNDPTMVNIKTRFGLLTLHTNTYLVKTSDDIFIMSKESYDELCLDEIENI